MAVTRESTKHLVEFESGCEKELVRADRTFPYNMALMSDSFVGRIDILIGYHSTPVQPNLSPLCRETDIVYTAPHITPG